MTKSSPDQIEKSGCNLYLLYKYGIKYGIYLH